MDNDYYPPTGKDSSAAAASDLSKLSVADQAAAVRAKRLSKQHNLLAPRKSTSNPTTAELLAQAIAKPSTVSPHDQMLLEPNARKHHELVPSDHRRHAPHHENPEPQMHLMSNVAPFKSHLARKEHHMFAATEETAVVRSIQSYHAPDGVEYAYDSKYVLNIVEDIFIRVSAVIPGIKHRIAVDERLDELHAENLMKGYTLSDLRDELAYPVHKISAELIWHCHSDGDGRKVSEKIFQSLAPYSWEAKVVIALAAFTMQYGEFWLVAELYRTHPLAGSVSLLMEIPEIMGNMEIFGPKFKAITDLVDAMLDVTRSIIELNEIFNKRRISRDAEDDISATLHLSVIPTASYWVIKSIVACSSILLNLMAMGHEYLTSQVNWELGSLIHKLSQTKGLLEEQWRKYQHKLDERRQLDLYLALKRIFGTSQYDNLIGTKALINNRDDPYPLYDGNDAMKKQLEVLKRKNVILLVSHLDIPAPEFEILLQLYHESRLYAENRVDSRIEVVWVPIINQTVASHVDPVLKARYHDIQKKMPWYSVSDPYMVEPGAVRFIREEWKFDEKPILVVLDPHGRVSNYDAIDMYWIWGFGASPFDEARERELWRDARWSMDLLVDTIDSTVHSWLTGNKYICVFGGDNIDWIRRFTTMARNVARQLDLPLELLYVGKSSSKELIRRNNDIIARENLSSVLPEFHTWFFWERLKCMWNSREKRGLPTVNDAIMQKIISVLIYDNSDRPWAVFGRGQYGEMAMQEGELVYKVLDEFSNWRGDIDHNNNFVKVLDDVLKDRRPENTCWRFVYPGSNTRAPPHIDWPECDKPMGKHLMYRCCSD
ncbi:hypothetical protein Leryth_018079 [Lithospermum erythrorhizon]|nr:hypothetical protein Leryth_018079 [Lithospermum erythrorhizon]